MRRVYHPSSAPDRACLPETKADRPQKIPEQREAEKERAKAGEDPEQAPYTRNKVEQQRVERERQRHYEPGAMAYHGGGAVPLGQSPYVQPSTVDAANTHWDSAYGAYAGAATSGGDTGGAGGGGDGGACVGGLGDCGTGGGGGGDSGGGGGGGGGGGDSGTT
jgi:hypothetical protein